MELKGLGRMLLELLKQSTQGIHYMELKEVVLASAVDPVEARLKNPLHGVERGQGQAHDVLRHGESITWS